jgi:hypothetical protein
MSVLLAMILASGITTHSPVYDLRYLRIYDQNNVAFVDITGKTRICTVGQYGVYWRGETAFQILGCSTDTLFSNGFST